MIYRNYISIKLYFFGGDEEDKGFIGISSKIKFHLHLTSILHSGFTSIPPLYFVSLSSVDLISHHFLNTSISSFLRRIFAFHSKLMHLCCGNLVGLIYFRISMQAWQHPRGPLHQQILLRKPQKRRLDKLPGCEG